MPGTKNQEPWRTVLRVTSKPHRYSPLWVAVFSLTKCGDVPDSSRLFPARYSLEFHICVWKPKSTHTASSSFTYQQSPLRQCPILNDYRNAVSVWRGGWTYDWPISRAPRLSTAKCKHHHGSGVGSGKRVETKCQATHPGPAAWRAKCWMKIWRTIAINKLWKHNCA